MRRLRVGIALALLIGLVATPSVAGGSAGGPTRTTAREVIGWFLPTYSSYMLEDVDWSVLSTAAYFGVDARADGTLVKTKTNGTATRDWRGWTSDWMGQVIDTAHANGAEVVLTVRRFGWDASGQAATTALLADPEAIATLATEIAEAVVERGADGVNLDLEPMIEGYDDEFVSLLAAIRAEFDARQSGLQLTFDSTGDDDFPAFPIAEAVTTGGADAVVIMGYDFNRRTSLRAGAVAPLGGAEYDVRDSVVDHLERAPADKVILGMPNYGRAWPTNTRYRHSLTRQDATRYGSSYAARLASADATAATHGRRWDPEHLVAWTRWRERACAGCPLTWWQLYYDDAVSYGLKYDLVNEHDLRGIAVWRLGVGWDRPGYWDLIEAKFST